MYTFLGLHFSKWLWIFWPLSWFLKLRIRPEDFPSDSYLSENEAKDVIYVLPRMNLFDVWVLSKLLRVKNLGKLRGEPRID